MREAIFHPELNRFGIEKTALCQRAEDAQMICGRTKCDATMTP